MPSIDSVAYQKILGQVKYWQHTQHNGRENNQLSHQKLLALMKMNPQKWQEIHEQRLANLAKHCASINPAGGIKSLGFSVS